VFREKMNQIKFSHWYPKLAVCYYKNDRQKQAELLAVFKTHYYSMNEQFITYDTWIESDKYYKLPETDLLVLLFRPYSMVHPAGLFTTIRRWTREKEKYYQSKTGKVFDVILQERMK
jgi:hypothetical protein